MTSPLLEDLIAREAPNLAVLFEEMLEQGGYTLLPPLRAGGRIILEYSGDGPAPRVIVHRRDLDSLVKAAAFIAELLPDGGARDQLRDALAPFQVATPAEPAP